MKTILAALAVSLALAGAAAPAFAAYQGPNSSWQEKALNNGY